MDALAENEKMFPKEIALERYESEATVAEREALVANPLVEHRAIEIGALAFAVESDRAIEQSWRS